MYVEVSSLSLKDMNLCVIVGLCVIILLCHHRIMGNCHSHNHTVSSSHCHQNVIIRLRVIIILCHHQTVSSSHCHCHDVSLSSCCVIVRHASLSYCVSLPHCVIVRMCVIVRLCVIIMLCVIVKQSCCSPLYLSSILKPIFVVASLS